MNYKPVFWLAVIPFFLFLLGYLVPAFIFNQKAGVCPSFIGQRIADAIKPISAFPLNVRISSEVINEELAEGTILQQKPEPGQRIKPYQSIYLVISRKKQQLCMPAVPLHAKVQNVSELLEKNGIHLKTYPLPSHLPNDTVIALWPIQGALLGTKAPSAYAFVAHNTSTLSIMPSLKKIPLEFVEQLIKKYDGIIQILNQPEELAAIAADHQPLVSEQRPTSGSIVDLKKQLTVYVTVE
ncbi:MAG: Serine/threonine-protein kinase PrkC family protein [candidate division TM6 bacterium GW2011_GWE2_41_16]|nr:MAG: Serine/threonine-protein kinase PrkC family protein [candidate division TM6 bacterium GW2011_GWE2_41_16]